jgi:hypothetical protein
MAFKFSCPACARIAMLRGASFRHAMRLALLFVTWALLSAPFPASGAELHSAYSVPIGGDEGDYAWIALGGRTLVVARSYDDRVDLHDARTGALRSTILCPGPDDDAAYGPPCNARPQASRRLLAFAFGADIDLYDHAGRFRRRLHPGGRVAGFALRGMRVLAGVQDGTDPPRAVLLDARTGAILRTFVPAIGDGVVLAAAFVRRGVVLGIGGGAGPGSVWGFDARTGAPLWNRTATAAFPGDEFGRSLAAMQGDVVAGGTEVHRLDGRTGQVVQTYESPLASPNFGREVAASGKLVAVTDFTHPSPEESIYGAVLVFDADSGALLDTLFHPPPPVSDLFGFGLAFDRGVLATTSDAYLGDGRVWVFRR